MFWGGAAIRAESLTWSSPDFPEGNHLLSSPQTIDINEPSPLWCGNSPLALIQVLKSPISGPHVRPCLFSLFHPVIIGIMAHPSSRICRCNLREKSCAKIA